MTTSQLINKGFFGYTPNGKEIELYPDAFANYETLVRTLGHERTHVFQVRLYGKPANTQIVGEFEKAAEAVEPMFYQYYKGGKLFK